MKKRNRKVLVQIGSLILALFALAAILNSQFIYLTSKANYIDTVEELTGQVLLETRTRMEAYAALPWLLDYWQTHTDTMELPGDRAQRAETVSRLLLERGGRADDLSVCGAFTASATPRPSVKSASASA